MRALIEGRHRDEAVRAARRAASDWNEEQLLQRWRPWFKKKIGGSELRVEAAARAAIHSLIRGEDRAEAILAARRAAYSWNEAQFQQKWRVWVVKNLGGSGPRVDAATRAAMSALSQGKHRRDAAWAACEAAAPLK